jgi:hypothetical protein
MDLNQNLAAGLPDLRFFLQNCAIAGCDWARMAATGPVDAQGILRRLRQTSAPNHHALHQIGTTPKSAQPTIQPAGPLPGGKAAGHCTDWQIAWLRDGKEFLTMFGQ